MVRIAQQLVNRPLRLGIYHTVQQADQAVHRLIEAGFTHKEIGILTSDVRKERFFPEMSNAELPGNSPGKAIPIGGALGALVGGIALGVTSILTGGLPLIGAGAILVGGGALAGSFAGAMATLGYDSKTIEYCEKAVQDGKILVAVTDYEEEGTGTLADAERILSETGAQPILAPVVQA